MVDAGIYLVPFEVALKRLQWGQSLTQFRDHALIRALDGMRSCDVGMMPDGRKVVMIYKVTRAWVAVAVVDEHDAAYRQAKLL